MAIAKVPAVSLYDTPLESLDQITRTVNRLVDEVNDLTTERLVDRAQANPPFDPNKIAVKALTGQIDALNEKVRNLRAEASGYLNEWALSKNEVRKLTRDVDVLKSDHAGMKRTLGEKEFALSIRDAQLAEEKSWTSFPTAGQTPSGVETRFQYRLKS